MISIITPTYNRAHLLPRMVNSVLNQTFKDWELIIVDDGSTDDTSQIVQNFKDSRIKYFPKENSGATASRNLGVNKAQGDYIIFLDSDDEAKANWLLEFHKKIEGGANLICCGMEIYNSDQKLISTTLFKNMGSLFGGLNVNYLAGTLLMKKEYFLDIGRYDDNLKSGQHFELFMRLYPYAVKNHILISLINSPLVNIHIHSGDRIRHNNHLVYEGTIKALKKHRKQFENHPDIFFDYLSVAAVSALKLNKTKEAKNLFSEAYRLRPFYYKALLRLVLSKFNFISKKIWN